METPTFVFHLRPVVAVSHNREGRGQKFLIQRWTNVSLCRRRIFIDDVKAWSVFIPKTSLKRSTFTQLDPRPLLSLRCTGVDTEEEELHSLLTPNFHKLRRVVRRQVKIQLT